jgi:pyruvate formate lyase activating enzyme
VGSWSCIFTCPWCQNHDISKTPPGNKKSQSKILSPYELVTMAKENNCKGTSMSFSEPATFLEYAVDVFELGAHAFNIDIKGDTETYKQYCNADVEKVWQNVRTIKEKGAHVELTTLVIPGINDDENCLIEIAERIKKEVGPETPWHISRYFPAYKFDRPPTPLSSLEKAYLIGKEKGLLYIYIGNVLGHKHENTYCPACGEKLVSRTGFTIHKNKLDEDKRCPRCGREIPIIGS